MKFCAFFAFLLAATVGISGNSASAAITNVSPGNPSGWSFYSTDASGVINTGAATGTFVNGPGSPPLGTGSFNFQTAPGQGDGSGQLRNAIFVGTKLSALTALSYSTYYTVKGADQVPYLTLYVDTNNDGIKDDRLFFEPEYSSGLYGNGDPNPQPGITANVWQTWDALNGRWYSENGPGGPGANTVSLAQYIAAHPLAALAVDGQGGTVRLTSGFTSPGDNFNTYVDNFTIGVTGDVRTFDFELAGPVPEPATLTLWSLGALGLAAARLRRRNSNA